MYTREEDRPRLNNKKLLIEFFDSFDNLNEFERLGKYEEFLYIAGIGSGKCRELNTPVLMYDGTIKRFKDIIVGDLLMGEDSTPRKVLGIHSVFDDAYKIIPVKGEIMVCKHDHILSLKRTNKGIIAKNGRRDAKAGKIVNMSVDEYLKLSKKLRGFLKLYRVGVEFKEKPVSIDPYFLGLWLGDGNSSTIGITTKDKEIKNYVYKTAKEQALTVTPNFNKNKTCQTYVLTTGTYFGTKDRNKLKEKFKQYNLLGNKHIPQCYKSNSREIRLSLLAGLIDTDGCMHNNTLEFSNKNEILIDDAVYLCRSLGFAAYKKERTTTCLGRAFRSFRVSISGDLSVIPIILKRKKCTKRTQKKDVLVTGIKSIEPIGKRKLIGFSVDKNHLFVDGTFTVDHNSFYSSKSIQYIVYRLLCLKSPQAYFSMAPGSKIAFINISKSFSQAKDVVFGEIKNRIDNSPWFQTYYPPDPRIKSVLKFKKNIFVLPLGSNEEAPLGYNIFGAIIDEASFHTATKDKDYAEESYNQIKKRITSRFFDKGKTFIITSPKYTQDFAERKFHDDDNPKLLKKRVPLWEAMPADRYSGEKFDIGNYLEEFKGVMCPVEYEQDFKQNAERAMRDFGAQPSLAIEAFFRDPSAIKRMINTKRKHPYSSRQDKKFHNWFVNSRSAGSYDSDKYFIHCDLGLNRGGKGDYTGICLGKFNGWQECAAADGKIEKRPKIYIAYMERITAGGPREEILFSEIRKRIYALKELGWNIGLTTFDGWNCCTGDTKIKLLDGTSKRIDEIINSTWLYGFNGERIIPTLCKSVRKTGEDVDVYKITLDNGESVKFTAEHLFLMRDGSYKQVSELKTGDSFLPLNSTPSKSSPLGYEKIYQPVTKKWEFTHRRVMKEITRRWSENEEVIHHKDFNSLNNSPENLVRMKAAEHHHMHKELSQRNGWKVSLANKGKKKSEQHNKRVSIGIKEWWKTVDRQKISESVSKTLKHKWANDKNYREKMRKRPVYTGDLSPRFNKNISNEKLFATLNVSNSLKDVLCELGCNRQFVFRRLKCAGYSGFIKYKTRNNHRVISVEYFGKEDVYDIEVPSTHNFGLSAGIFVHNSVDMIQTLNSAGFKAEVFSVDRNPDSYYTLKAALLEGRLDYYYYQPFIEELQQLEEIKGSKIDHPRHGHKDVADAVAAVCYRCAQGKPGTGIFGI